MEKYVCVCDWGGKGESERFNSPYRWMTQARCCWHICPHRWLLVSLQEPERRRMSDGSRTYCRWDVCEIYTCIDSILFAICQCFHPIVMCDWTCMCFHGQKSNQQSSLNVIIIQCHLDKEKQVYFLFDEGRTIHPEERFFLTFILYQNISTVLPGAVTLLPWQLIAFPVSMLRSWLVLDLLGNNIQVGSRKQKLEQNLFHYCKTVIKRTFLATASTSLRNTPTHKSTNMFGGVKHDVGPPWPQHCLWSFLASLTAWLYGLKGPDVRVLLRPDLHVSKTTEHSEYC